MPGAPALVRRCAWAPNSTATIRAARFHRPRRSPAREWRTLLSMAVSPLHEVHRYAGRRCLERVRKPLAHRRKAFLCCLRVCDPFLEGGQTEHPAARVEADRFTQNGKHIPVCRFGHLGVKECLDQLCANVSLNDLRILSVYARQCRLPGDDQLRIFEVVIVVRAVLGIGDHGGHGGASPPGTTGALLIVLSERRYIA